MLAYAGNTHVDITGIAIIANTAWITVLTTGSLLRIGRLKQTPVRCTIAPIGGAFLPVITL
jgi:hypothetical protein